MCWIQYPGLTVLPPPRLWETWRNGQECPYPTLNHSRIMLETWNVARKQKSISNFKKYTQHYIKAIFCLECQFQTIVKEVIKFLRSVFSFFLNKRLLRDSSQISLPISREFKRINFFYHWDRWGRIFYWFQGE